MRMFFGLALLLAVSLCGAATISGQIVGVVDGDTVDVLTADHEQIRIRVAGIDAPEKGQAFGQRSKQKMAELVFGKPATVQFDKRDRYGRTIGKVFVNGRDAGLALLDAGLAWHYKKYEKEQSESDRWTYADAEQNARRSRVGLWVDAEPVAPWDWRKGARN